MNVGPIGSNIMPAAASNAQNVAAAAPSEDSKGGNIAFESPATKAEGNQDKSLGNSPQPLKQMSTSDFLSLREASQGENVMDKLKKIFETILALKLLEETVENVNKSIEEQTSKGDK